MISKWTFPVIGAVLLATLPFSSPATAAPIAAIYTINASGFGDLVGSSAPPTDPVRLDVSINFDPAAGDQFNYGTGISLRRSSVAISGPIAYDYDSTNDVLSIGGAGLSASITAGTNDFLTVLTGLRTGAPSLAGVEYTTALSSGIYLNSAGGVAVPEPASMVVLLGSLFGMASLRRRH
ncbi:MAG: PEP-CTERM sorting domain-containing protein [Janthinobacterium lividum]